MITMLTLFCPSPSPGIDSHTEGSNPNTLKVRENVQWKGTMLEKVFHIYNCTRETFDVDCLECRYVSILV